MAASRGEAKALAYAALEGVGDPALGEWTEKAGAFHLRRRLTAREAYRVGPVRDIRGTEEERRRFAVLLRAAPWVGDAM
jgi:hypothetical protein